MTGTVIIGRTIADAKGYAEAHGLTDVSLISPQSFHVRFRGLQVERFYVTRDAFKHPNICPVVLTVQTFMRKQTKEASR
ncbi:hypothetical protein SAMN04487912_102360 [Arthrobacter sp. cf158]|nr:hypothetical protein SAMN04487912_102360 [Arthrobacter sp. cf158]